MQFFERGAEGIEAKVAEQAIRDPEASGADLLAFEEVLREIESKQSELNSFRLANVLRDSRRGVLSPIEWSDPLDQRAGDQTPRWSTGCKSIDDVTGGGYGMTVLGGAPKVGKSLMAISAAIESARAGWNVVYANAEMSIEHLLLRFRNFMGKADPIVGKNLHIANVGPGITIDRLYEEIREEGINHDADRLLIVLDSINRIVDFSLGEGDEGYWKALADWAAWGMNSRRTTDGRISWLIVSELNSQGQVKGRNLEYTADMVIRISSTSVDDVVNIDVPYSRATRAATIGPAFRDFERGKFVQHG
jgi:predicted ATP-dependent serine protease